MPRTRRGIAYISAALLSVILVVTWIGARPRTAGAGVPGQTPEVVAASFATNKPGGAPHPADSPVTLAQRDPRAFVRYAQRRYEDTVKCYRTTLTKQELLGSGMSKVQVVEVRYRCEPTTIYMLWHSNADACKRALFIDDPANVNKKGEKLARVEPNGLARLIVSDIMMPVDGPDAKKASRHSIEFAGFQAFFDIFERYSALAESNGDLKLRFSGTGQVNGRPTIVITRDLPYTGENSKYPDARLVTHIDQELLLPVAAYSYADHDETKLLGSYIYTDIELNPPFGDDAFRF